MSPHHKKLVIGIDYGTTNSGVAYAVVTDDNADDKVDINVVRDWPHGGREEKLPSDIAYDNASGKPVGYAFDFPDDVQPLQWVKLLLEPAKLGKARQGNDRVWRSYSELNRLGKLPVDAITDYLRWLWGQVEKSLRDSGDDIGTDETVVVLTLPASWSDQAKNRMLQAAQKAGIDADGRILKFRIEPEAAALFELKARAKKGQIAVGDCFIVCDAGGGTVDVVTFQVISLDPLSLNQVVVAEADFCGSAFINAEFESQLRFFLGSDYDRLSSDVQNQIRDRFEHRIKRRYNPLVPAEYSVPVTGLEDNEKKGIKDGKFVIKESMLQRSFEEIMTQVLTLIDGQKEALKAKNVLNRLKAILLVGGFGASEYLHTRVRQEYPDNEDVRVWRGAQSWTAVVQGAVQCEVANRKVYAPVNTRLSRFHYGIPYRRGQFRKVHWFVHKGENVRDSSHIEPYLLRLEDRPWLDDDEYVTISVQLVKSTKDAVTEDDDSSLEPHVDINCRVPTSIRYSPGAELIQTHPGIWRIPAELILAMDGPLLTIRCRIQGKDVGILDLKYHDEPAFPSHGHTSVQTMVEPVRSPDRQNRNGVSFRADSSSSRPVRWSATPQHSSTMIVPVVDNGNDVQRRSDTADSVLSRSSTASIGKILTSPLASPLAPPILTPDEPGVRPASAESSAPSSPRPVERHSRSPFFLTSWKSNGKKASGSGSEQDAATGAERKALTTSNSSSRPKSNEREANNQNSRRDDMREHGEWVPCRNKRTGEEMLRSRVTGEVVPAPSKEAHGYGLH